MKLISKNEQILHVYFVEKKTCVFILYIYIYIYIYILESNL